MKPLAYHPVADMFPLIDGAESEELVEDMRKHGQRHAILTHKGQIIDGRNRYRACQVLKKRPVVEEWDGKGSLTELSASLNLHRRHLTAALRTVAGVAVEEGLAAEAKDRMVAGGRSKGLAKLPTPADALHARDRAAKLCGVSSRYIGEAKAIKASDPAVYADLAAGKLTVSQAKRAVQRSAKVVKLNGTRLVAPALGDAWEVRTGDCLKVLPTLPRKHCRLIIADPPYNIGIDYGKGSKADRLPDGEYVNWVLKWMDELIDCLTPDGSLWIVIGDEYAADYVVAAKLNWNLKLRAWVKWYETFGTNCSDNFNRTSRHLLYFVRDPKRYVFNHAAFNRPSARQAKYKDKRAAAGGKLWDDVWQIPRLVDNAAERVPGFPTQLPLGLIRPIVAGCSEPGDHVLDPFNGSGTTGEACILEGRRYLGIELSPTYADLARRRLTNAATGGVPVAEAK